MRPYILTWTAFFEDRERYPLDEEQPNSGVTEIHYLNNGKWEEL